MFSSKKYFFIIYSIITFFISCKNEVPVDTTFEEKTLVWCLLDAGETEHYLRIQKSFLQEGTNAYTLALDPANIYYADGELDVYVEKWVDETYIGKFTAKQIDGDTLGIEKEEGIFASQPNILYTFSGTLDTAATYKLFVINNISCDTLSAQTELVHAFKPLSPGYFTVTEDYADTGDISYQCKYAVNGKIYELMMEFVYAEKNTITGDSSVHSIYWQIFNSQLADNLTGYGNIAYEIPRNSFYTFVKNNIDENENMRRTFLHLNYTFYAGANDLYYLYLNGFALSGLAELYATNPYTNISNGYGIFSSRYAVEVDSVFLTPNSLDTLACGISTRQLNFTSSIYNPAYPGCF